MIGTVVTFTTRDQVVTWLFGRQYPLPVNPYCKSLVWNVFSDVWIKTRMRNAEGGVDCGVAKAD